MEPRIEKLAEKLLIGKSVRMSLTANKTRELWQGFMTERKRIENTVGTALYAIQMYDDVDYFKRFNPNTVFTKWAATEVANLNNIPIGFSSLIIPQGLYAVFLHKGLPSDFPETANYIYGHWIPNSDYVLDNRPHFEVLGDAYKNNDPASEEEVWIPIKKKT